MSAGQIAALYAVWAIAVISPGPDLVVVVQRSLAGRRHGLATAVGVVTGISLWLVAAFAGLAAVVAVYPQVMVALQVAGGVLLAGLGVLGLRGWRRARTGSTTTAPTAPATAPGPSAPTRDLARGLATNMANPKAVVFFGAVLAPFLRGGVPAGQSVLVVGGLIAVALAWFVALALAASHPGVHARLQRVLPWVDPVVAALFVAVGVAFVIGAATAPAGG